MKLLSKSVVGIESALTASIAALWNQTAQVTRSITLINAQGTKTGEYSEPIVQLITVTEYPYQPFCIVLGIVAVTVGLGFLTWKLWKNRPMPKNYLEGFEVIK